MILINGKSIKEDEIRTKEKEIIGTWFAPTNISATILNKNHKTKRRGIVIYNIYNNEYNVVVVTCERWFYKRIPVCDRTRNESATGRTFRTNILCYVKNRFEFSLIKESKTNFGHNILLSFNQIWLIGREKILKS